MPDPSPLQPTLTSPLLTIRPLTESDFDALFAVASDPLIWEQHPARDRYTAPGFRKYFTETLASGGALLIIDNETGEVIGASRYNAHDPEARELEIGWTFLARSRWGGRYNAELKRLMLDHAFTFVDRVLLMVGVDNTRSQKAVERLGATKDRIIPANFETGRTADHIVYALTKDAWQTRPASTP